MRARLLLVEDDFSTRLGLTASLKAAGHDVEAVASAEEAEASARDRPPELVILDRGLPRESGLELLRRWRREGRDWPVLVLTARDAVEDRVEGLRAGASDYVVKPAATEELLARVEARLRERAPASAPRPVIELGHARVDLARLVVERSGEELALTSLEASLLELLNARAGRLVTREELLREVWGFRAEVETRAVDNTVYRLRAKIEVDAARPRHLLTIRGEGDRFEVGDEGLPR